MSGIRSSNDSNTAADLDGLRIANNFMMQEVETGEPTRTAFGGAYEVLYRGPAGFERVDDVLHCFVAARVLFGQDRDYPSSPRHATMV